MPVPTDGIDSAQEPRDPEPRSDTVVWCPCGSRRREAYYWHKTLEHECVYHKRAQCKVCVMVAEAELMLIEAAG